MLEIDRLSKETVYKVMFNLLRVTNWQLYKLEDVIRASHPEVLKSQEYLKLIEEYGLREAKGLAEVLGISGNGIDSLIQLLQYSHWVVFEGFEVEKLTEESCRMRVIECSVQRAAKKEGVEYYECADETLWCLRGFCGYINRKMSIRQVFGPPEEVRPKGIPENVSCEWVISMEGAKTS